MKFLLLLAAVIIFLAPAYEFAQAPKTSSSFKIARLKYAGGGDWYNDPTEETNLLKFVRQHTLVAVEPVYEFVEISSDKFFTYPFIFINGPGNVNFNDLEIKPLRRD